MTSTLTYAFMIVISINACLWLGQVAMLDINPDATEYITCEGTALGTVEANNCQIQGSYYLTDEDPTTRLPSSESSISPTTGNIFTDSFTAIKNWFLETTGLSYLVQVLSAPSNFLKAIGVPSEISFAFGGLWYLITLFLIIAFFTGREM